MCPFICAIFNINQVLTKQYIDEHNGECMFLLFTKILIDQTYKILHISPILIIFLDLFLFFFQPMRIVCVWERHTHLLSYLFFFNGYLLYYCTLLHLL